MFLMRSRDWLDQRSTEKQMQDLGPLKIKETGRYTVQLTNFGVCVYFALAPFQYLVTG